MPAKYEAIRDEFIKKGMSRKEAERRAALIYNARRTRGETPVTGKHKQSALSRELGKHRKG